MKRISRWFTHYQRPLLVTKFTIILMCAMLLQTQGGVLSQNVTISGANLPLKKVFREIEHQSKYDFFYNTSLMKMAKPVTLHVTSAPLTEVLRQCFAGQPLDYYIQDSTVFVIRRESPVQGPGGDTARPKAMPNHSVTGKILNDKGEPVSGASVLLKGSNVGQKADSNGAFTIKIPEGPAVLIFSHVGYATEEASVGDRSTVDIVMESISKSITEVTISIGYGTLAEREVSAAITHLSSKDLLSVAGNNGPLMAIQGKVAGLSVVNTATADPNSSPSLQLRGVSSRSAGLGPLYVIDNVPGGNLDNVNQNDVESIDILKGGAASAIYGTRGSNGVIIITTKKGSAQPQMLYDGYTTFDFATDKLKVLSAKEFLSHPERGTNYGGNTDWLSAVSRDYAFSQKHTLQFSGGTSKVNYIATLDYRNANGIDLYGAKQEYGARININHTSNNNVFQASLNVAPRYENINNADYNSFNWALSLNPTIPVHDSTGGFFPLNIAGFGSHNPVEDATLPINQQTVKELDINTSLKLNILKNLNTVVTIGEINSNQRNTYFLPSTMTTVLVSNGGNGRNYASQSLYQNDQQSLEWIGNYSLHIKKHSFTLLGGYSYEYFEDDNFGANNQQIPNDAYTYNNLGSGLWNQSASGAAAGAVSSYKEDSKLIAFYGRLTYDFDKRYFLTASLRHEGSSRFGQDHKWGDFPALSAAWRLSDEHFFPKTSWINELKLQADYGVSGNQNFSDYTSLNIYTGYGYYPYLGTFYQDYGPGQNLNLNLGWETAISYNAGLEFGLFDNSVNGTLTYFQRTNKDLIGPYAVPEPPNLQPTTTLNVGTIKNSGVEIQLSARLVHKRDFSYSLSLAAATNGNKFVSFSNSLYQASPYVDMAGLPAPGSPGTVQRLQEGKRIGSFYMLKAAGDSAGNMMVYNAAGKIIPANQAGTADKQFVGNGLPKFTGSLGNTFTYKNWDLSIFLRGAFGYQIFNTPALYIGTPATEQNANTLTSAYNGSRYSKLTSNNTYTIASSYFLENGNFVKIDNVSLGYTPHFVFKYLRSLRVYVTARNLHAFTKYTGGDPDLISANGLTPGINTSLSYYPSTLQLLFGVRLNF